jgi:hypothetical protein
LSSIYLKQQQTIKKKVIIDSNNGNYGNILINIENVNISKHQNTELVNVMQFDNESKNRNQYLRPALVLQSI